jgi:hypothetical protein
LRCGARRLAELAHAGLDEARCRSALEEAAIHNGLWADDGPRQCRASIESGWAKGISEPADTSDLGYQQPTTKTVEPTKSSTNGSHVHSKAKTNGKPVTNGAVFEELGERTVKLRRASTIKSRVPTWIWDWDGVGRIQHGTLTMFAGKPTAGKSTAVRWFAAQLSKGELPGVWYGHPMRVAMIMAEEQTDAVVKPGLQAAGANLDNIFFPEFAWGSVESSFMSEQDEQRLTEQLLYEECAMLIIDPIMSAFGAKADIYRNNEVRAALAPFTRMATAINGGVIGVTHLKKGEIKEVLGGMNGSSAFGEVPRAVFGFAPTDGGEHVMQQVKNSAGPTGLKLSYTLPIEYLLADDGQPIELPRFNITGPTEIGIEDIDSNDNETTGISVACQWLNDYLQQEQPAQSSQVKRDAKQFGDIGEKMISRAAKRVGVVIKSQSMPGKPHTTVWSLPGYGDWDN